MLRVQIYLLSCPGFGGYQLGTAEVRQKHLPRGGRGGLALASAVLPALLTPLFSPGRRACSSALSPTHSGVQSSRQGRLLPVVPFCTLALNRVTELTEEPFSGY